MKYRYLIAYKKTPFIIDRYISDNYIYSTSAINATKIICCESAVTILRKEDVGAKDMVQIIAITLLETIEDREKVICKCGNDKWVQIQSFSYNSYHDIYGTTYECSDGDCKEVYEVRERQTVLPRETTLYKEEI